MYYVAPASCLFLSLPFFALEAPQLVKVGVAYPHAAWGLLAAGHQCLAADGRPRDWLARSSAGATLRVKKWRPSAQVGLGDMSRATALASAGMAFSLNCASFLLIGNTSALTLQLAGVVKDWLLIVMSAAVFRHALTPLNLGGYGVAFAGAFPGWIQGSWFRVCHSSMASAHACMQWESKASAVLAFALLACAARCALRRHAQACATTTCPRSGRHKSGRRRAALRTRCCRPATPAQHPPALRTQAVRRRSRMGMCCREVEGKAARGQHGLRAGHKNHVA